MCIHALRVFGNYTIDRMKSSTKKTQQEAGAALPHMDDEVENVEYLEECVTDDNEGVSESSTPHPPVFNDTFYPNAVQCLLTLYRHKYQQMNDQHEVQTLYKSIWEDISKDMRESYFQFDADQVKHKFTLLRKQYFSVSSKVEAAKFAYFHYFHDMYCDKVISGFLNGDSTPLPNSRKNKCTYRDDLLFAEIEIQEMIHNQKHTDEIAHKEHEFINMVERELKAMANESSKTKLTTEPSHYESSQKRERQDSNEGHILTCHAPKRPYNNTFKFKKAETSEPTQSEANIRVSNDDKGDMTLTDYNKAQQRRHEEKMNLLRQNLLLQERLMEVQNKLLEEIIKRV